MPSQESMQQAQQQKASKLEVIVHGKRTVVPSEPSQPTIHRVSALDSVLGNFYLHKVYFFKSLPLRRSADTLIEDLNEGLSQALQLFPTMAGRLRLLDDGKLGIKLNDAGLRVLEASSDSSLCDWISCKNAPCSRSSAVLAPEIRISDYSVSPLASVQYTKLRCGGFIIGLSWCHLLCDLHSMSRFVKLWAAAHSSDLHFLEQEDDAGDEDDRRHSLVLRFSEAPPCDPPLDCRQFQMSAKAVQRLSPDRRSQAPLLCAHLWKSLAMAMALPEHHISRFFLWKPQSLSRSLGNRGMSMDAYDATPARLASQTVAQVAEMMAAPPPINGAAAPPVNAVFICNYAADVQCYGADFGGGRPSLVEVSALPLFGDGFVVVVPSNSSSDGAAVDGDDRGLTVSVSLRSDAMQRLLQDTFFLNPPPPSPVVGAPAA